MEAIAIKLRHWLPPLGAIACLLLAARMFYVSLDSPHSDPQSIAGPVAFLVILAFGLFRRWNWARWIAAVLCFLIGLLCAVGLVAVFFPGGIYGPEGTPTGERTPVALGVLFFLPPAVLLPVIAHLMRPVRQPKSDA